jgi:hypothetical protein
MGKQIGLIGMTLSQGPAHCLAVYKVKFNTRQSVQVTLSRGPRKKKTTLLLWTKEKRREE